MWVFDYTELGAGSPDPYVIQGSSVYLHKAAEKKIWSKLNIELTSLF